jgi:hypothetical protein
MCQAPARLLDITAQGAGLLSLGPADAGQVLWVGVVSLPCEWVKATIRAAIRQGTSWRYSLAFCEPCPAGLLERASAAAGEDREVHGFFLVLREDEDGAGEAGAARGFFLVSEDEDEEDIQSPPHRI